MGGVVCLVFGVQVEGRVGEEKKVWLVPSAQLLGSAAACLLLLTDATMVVNVYSCSGGIQDVRDVVASSKCLQSPDARQLRRRWSLA